MSTPSKPGSKPRAKSKPKDHPPCHDTQDSRLRTQDSPFLAAIADAKAGAAQHDSLAQAVLASPDCLRLGAALRDSLADRKRRREAPQPLPSALLPPLP